MTIEYKIALIIPVVFLICQFVCPAKLEALFFPNTSYFSNKKYNFPWSLFLAVFFISIALSSPVTTKIYNNKTQKGYDIIMDLDTSGSMALQNKLVNAKSLIVKFINKRKNDRIGLVVFGNIAYIASPLTYDKKNFTEILKRIYPNIAGGRTAIYDALFLSTTLFKKSHAKNKILILITDGMDNESKTPRDVVINTLKKQHIKVYAIGLGEFVNIQDLKDIAQKTDGQFFWIRNPDQLQNVYQAIEKNEKSNIHTKTTIQKHYYFQYPLFLGIIFFLFFLYKYRRSIWNF